MMEHPAFHFRGASEPAKKTADILRERGRGDAQYTRATRRGRHQRQCKVTARCCSDCLCQCTRLRPRRLLLSSASLPAGIYCPSKMLVAAVVVMAAVMVVNVVVGVVKHLYTAHNTYTSTGTYTYTYSGSSIPRTFKPLRVGIKAH